MTDNNPNYSGEIQEFIWNLTTNRVPLEVTLPMIPEDMHAPCTDLFNFMTYILNDMYQNPKENNITDKNSVWFYIRHFFEWMYKRLEYCDGVFTASKGDYKKLLKKLDPQNTEIMFARHGFLLDTNEDIVHITNSRYPEMMRAVGELLEASYSNYSVNCTDYLTACDFRALVKYKRTYFDMLTMLNSDGQEIASQLEGFASELGVKPVKCTYFNRVEFKRKGKIVFVLDVMNQKHLKVNIGFAEIGGDSFKMIENEIGQYGDYDEFTGFVRKNFKKCTSCNAECGKRNNPIEVFGKKTVVCQAYIRIYEPKKEDIKHIFRLIELRTMAINAGISDVFYPGNG